MSARASLLLALHSSSDCLAVGLQALADPEPPRVQAFPLGRQLSNALLPCLEQVLPAERWPEIGRLVVATGPGGFTSTRLTVVLARTLAQQLAVPLHGLGSFLLVARRMLRQRPELAAAEVFWLAQDLPRRGTVAGCYAADPLALGGVAERQPPRLYGPGEAFAAGLAAELILPAAVEAPLDVVELLALGQVAAAQGLDGPWQPVLPIYPTSPVEFTASVASPVPPGSLPAQASEPPAAALGPTQISASPLSPSHPNQAEATPAEATPSQTSSPEAIASEAILVQGNPIEANPIEAHSPDVSAIPATPIPNGPLPSGTIPWPGLERG